MTFSSPAGSPSKYFFAEGIAQPYAQNWIPAPAFMGTDKMHSGTGISAKSGQWWHLSIRPFEVYYNPRNAPPPSTQQFRYDDALSRGNSVSICKFELSYVLGSAQQGIVRADIGAGIECLIPPQWNVTGAKLLIPDPTSAPNQLPVPINTTTGEAQIPPENDITFASVFITTIRCVDSPIGRNNLRWSQPYLLINGAAVGSGNYRAAEIVQPHARRVTVEATNLAGDPNLSVVALWGRGDGTAIGVAGLSDGRVGAGDTLVQRTTSIPGSANILWVGPLQDPGSVGLVNIIQELDI